MTPAEVNVLEVFAAHYPLPEILGVLESICHDNAQHTAGAVKESYLADAATLSNASAKLTAPPF